jgi:hypothetical protein
MVLFFFVSPVTMFAPALTYIGISIYNEVLNKCNR